MPQPAADRTEEEQAALLRLEVRLGRRHARQRLGIERDHEAQVFGQGLTFFHLENLTSSHRLIEWTLKLSGLYWRGRRNAARVRLNLNLIESDKLPPAFDGFRILHLSDLHADMSEGAMTRAAELVAGLGHDLCVLTGDFRGRTFGPFATCMASLRRLRSSLAGSAYAVLGNHDTIMMTPVLEDMGIRVLLNEAETIRRGVDRIHVAGVDDAHFYRADNIEKAAASIPPDEFAILLSHTPEIYRQAAHADFDVMLSGHTHGGQICLPGGWPLTLGAAMPRRYGTGAWRYAEMAGYTSRGAGSSVVPVRFNCPPEVTLHTLRRISRGDRAGPA
ncbi:MAG: metallophosphoesterase [Hyphomicrobiales bacterium]|nr:metallophosphoesterase [Hyphomicrobiales bacterium]